jgi:hypothetical protein
MAYGFTCPKILICRFRTEPNCQTAWQLALAIGIGYWHWLLALAIGIGYWHWLLALAIGIGYLGAYRLGGMADIFNLYQAFWERAKVREILSDTGPRGASSNFDHGHPCRITAYRCV